MKEYFLVKSKSGKSYMQIAETKYEAVNVVIRDKDNYKYKFSEYKVKKIK